MIALVFLVGVVVVAVSAPLITSHPPNYQDLLSRHAGPSADHWLGTDDLGRDTFARLVYGARTSMLIAVLVGLLATLIAVPIGLASGYWSGKTDVIVMRLTDALLAVPPLVLALVIAGIIGPGTRNIVIALVVLISPGLVRVVRGQTLAVREEGYIDSSKAIGTPSVVIIARRVFPHVLSPLLVQVSLVMGSVLVVEASLSFLGLGEPPPNATWGGMLQNGFAQIATDARLALVPAIAISATTLAFNALGDGVRESLQGAHERRRRRGDVLGKTSIASRTAPTRPPVEASSADDPGNTVLSLRNLSVGFDASRGVVRVLDGVDLDIRRGEIMGLVGESGCGKTVTALSVLRLLPSPPARILGGQVLFEGRDLLRASGRALRDVRGGEIAMVFQDPIASLNPALTVGDQIVEAQRLHRNVTRSAARARAAELLDLVGIHDARRRLDEFPHTLSGGMRQRALIAMALANDPKLLIADEPTTALDVTVQAQIIELIRRVRDEFGTSVLFVTHDLGVVEELCDRVTVMYAGHVVEVTSVAAMFAAPKHPYSAALLRSRPRVGSSLERLPSIPGLVPAHDAMPAGCRFRARCEYANELCATAQVPLQSLDGGRAVRCARHLDLTLAESEDRPAALPVGR